MIKDNCKVGQSVRRIQPGDYTNGRTGEIVEIAQIDPRVRVLWKREKSGREIIPNIRTWINVKRIEGIESDIPGLASAYTGQGHNYKIDEQTTNTANESKR